MTDNLKDPNKNQQNRFRIREDAPASGAVESHGRTLLSAAARLDIAVQQQRMKEITLQARQTSKSQKAKSERRKKALEKIVKVESEASLQPRRKASQKKTVLDKMQSQATMSGPLRVLYDCVTCGYKVKVWIRRYNGLRGVLTGYLVAFDFHMNLALIDVNEIFTIETWMIGDPIAKKKKKKSSSKKPSSQRVEVQPLKKLEETQKQSTKDYLKCFTDRLKGETAARETKVATAARETKVATAASETKVATATREPKVADNELSVDNSEEKPNGVKATLDSLPSDVWTMLKKVLPTEQRHSSTESLNAESTKNTDLKSSNGYKKSTLSDPRLKRCVETSATDTSRQSKQEIEYRANDQLNSSDIKSKVHENVGSELKTVVAIFNAGNATNTGPPKRRIDVIDLSQQLQQSDEDSMQTFSKGDSSEKRSMKCKDNIAEEEEDMVDLYADIPGINVSECPTNGLLLKPNQPYRPCPFIFHSIGKRLSLLKERRSRPRAWLERKQVRTHVAKISPLFETEDMRSEFSSDDETLFRSSKHRQLSSLTKRKECVKITRKSGREEAGKHRSKDKKLKRILRNVAEDGFESSLKSSDTGKLRTLKVNKSCDENSINTAIFNLESVAKGSIREKTVQKSLTNMASTSTYSESSSKERALTKQRKPSRPQEFEPSSKTKQPGKREFLNKQQESSTRVEKSFTNLNMKEPRSESRCATVKRYADSSSKPAKIHFLATDPKAILGCEDETQVNRIVVKLLENVIQLVSKKIDISSQDFLTVESDKMRKPESDKDKLEIDQRTKVLSERIQRKEQRKHFKEAKTRPSDFSFCGEQKKRSFSDHRGKVTSNEKSAVELNAEKKSQPKTCDREDGELSSDDGTQAITLPSVVKRAVAGKETSRDYRRNSEIEDLRRKLTRRKEGCHGERHRKRSRNEANVKCSKEKDASVRDKSLNELKSSLDTKRQERSKTVGKRESLKSDEVRLTLSKISSRRHGSSKTRTSLDSTESIKTSTKSYGHKGLTNSEKQDTVRSTDVSSEKLKKEKHIEKHSSNRKTLKKNNIDKREEKRTGKQNGRHINDASMVYRPTDGKSLNKLNLKTSKHFRNLDESKPKVVIANENQRENAREGDESKPKVVIANKIQRENAREGDESKPKIVSANENQRANAREGDESKPKVVITNEIQRENVREGDESKPKVVIANEVQRENAEILRENAREGEKEDYKEGNSTEKKKDMEIPQKKHDIKKQQIKNTEESLFPEKDEMDATRNCVKQSSEVVAGINKYANQSQPSRLLPTVNDNANQSQPSRLLPTVNDNANQSQPSHLLPTVNDNANQSQPSRLLPTVNDNANQSQPSRLLPTVNDNANQSQPSRLLPTVNDNANQSQPSRLLPTVNDNANQSQPSRLLPTVNDNDDSLHTLQEKHDAYLLMTQMSHFIPQSREESVAEADLPKASEKNTCDLSTMNVFQRRKHLRFNQQKKSEEELKTSLPVLEKVVEFRLDEDFEQNIPDCRATANHVSPVEIRLTTREKRYLDSIRPITFEPLKPRKGLVYKKRRANQLFVRGDNIVMVAYDKVV